MINRINQNNQLKINNYYEALILQRVCSGRCAADHRCSWGNRVLPRPTRFKLEWSHPAWEGRWALDVNGVTADMLCSDKTKTKSIIY